MNKNNVRDFMLDKRINRDKSELELLSNKICEKFFNKFYNEKVFLFYMPIKNEVNVFPLIEKLYSVGKEIYLPIISDNVMSFREYNGFTNLQKGKFNILEPTGKLLEKKYNVIVIPAIAFDYNCYRLGYGKGFYDRFLATSDVSITVGVAYDFQVIENIYYESHDKPVDIVITDRRIFRRN